MSTPPKPPQPSTPKPNRLPAPALFVGPPSHNASTSSLLPPAKDAASRPPLPRQHSLLSDARKGKERSGAPSPLLSPTDRGRAADAALLSPLGRERSHAAPAPAGPPADALWADMQSTLREVGGSAAARGLDAVFGPGHARALEELRRAQVGLAQAWARSDGEEGEGAGAAAEAGLPAPKARDVGGAPDGLGERAPGVAPPPVREQRSNTATTMATTATTASGREALEEETENDIALARKRREANDRYFNRVNKGVLDVISKLEEVAKAMKSVEMESKEIWGEGEGLDEG